MNGMEKTHLRDRRATEAIPGSLRNKSSKSMIGRNFPLKDSRQKHQIASSVIAGWMEIWDNGEKFDDYHLYPGVYAMAFRKATVEEQLEIVQWVIDHELNYTAAAAKFELKYATIYQWTQRYLQEGKEGLNRQRGRKPKQVVDPSLLTETQRLQLELEELKKLNYRLDLENRVLKKKQEIERRNRAIK